MAIKIIFFLILSVFISSSLAFSGNAGLTSARTLSINVIVPTQVVINGVNDFVSTWNGSDRLTLRDNICLGSNNEGQNYQIKAIGHDIENSLSRGSIDYSVRWASQVNSINGKNLKSAIKLGPQANTQTLSCLDDNATLIIDIAEKQLQTSPVGSYSGIITLIVTPE